MTTNKDCVHPIVNFSGIMSGTTIQGLIRAIRETTGIWFGYTPIKLIDVHSFYDAKLTLCGKTGLSKQAKINIEVTIKAWCLGFGLQTPVISWSDNDFLNTQYANYP